MTSSDEFFFIQAADCQLGMIEEYLENNSDPHWDREIALCEQAISKINSMEPRPRFMVMCGDLVHTFPNSSHEDRRQRQIADFKKVFAKLDPAIPLVCVCGNHDIGNTPTTSSVKAYNDTFGEDYLAITYGTTKFIVINSQYYEDSSEVPELAARHNCWLEDQLKQLAGDTSLVRGIVLQHIPWFLQHPDEDNEYFNIDRSVRKLWLDKFKAAGISHVFCGHYHRNAGGQDGDLQVVVTSALGAQLGADGHGFRVVRVTPDAVQHLYFTLDEMPCRLDEIQW